MLNWESSDLIDLNGFPVNAIRDLQAILSFPVSECSYRPGHMAFILVRVKCGGANVTRSYVFRVPKEGSYCGEQLQLCRS